MNKIAFIGVLLLLAFASCRKNRSEQTTALEGRWKMVSVKDKTTSQVMVAPAGADGKVYITFSGKKFAGKTINNTITDGDFELKSSTDIVFGIYTSTNATEDDWGRRMMTMLSACMVQSVAPCRPSTFRLVTNNLLEVDLPYRYTLTFERF